MDTGMVVTLYARVFMGDDKNSSSGIRNQNNGIENWNSAEVWWNY